MIGTPHLMLSSNESISSDDQIYDRRRHQPIVKQQIKQSQVNNLKAKNEQARNNDISQLYQMIEDIQRQLREKDETITKLCAEVEELKMQLGNNNQQQNQYYLSGSSQNENYQDSDDSDSTSDDRGPWKKNIPRNNNNKKIWIRELNQEQSRQILIKQLEQKAKNIKTPSRELIKMLIEYVKSREPGDIFQEIELNNRDFISKFVNNLKLDWFDQKIITDKGELKHTTIAAKYLQSWGIRLSFTQKKLWDVPDEIWLYMFNAMSENKYYSIDFQKRTDFVIIRRVDDDHIFKFEEFTIDNLEQYRRELEDWKCDAFISVSQQRLKKPFFKIRHLAYCRNGNQEAEIKLKYPTELRSCYLHHTVITNLKKCENLKIMTCFESHTEQELKESGIKCNYYKFNK